MTLNRKDAAAGTFFMAVALLYGGMAYHSLPMGRALNMGPGYFPIVLSTILFLLGLAIVVRSFATKPASGFGVVPWRAVIMLSLAAVVCAAFLRELGMLPGIFITSLIASMSSPQIKPLPAVLVSLCIALFCVAVFSYGINLPLPILGSWFGY